MKKLLGIFSLLAIAALAIPAAKADSFNFNYSGSGITETAVVTTTNTLNSAGAYTILSVVGQINGVSFVGLSSFASADQYLYPTGPAVDFSGVSFAGANGVNYTIGYYGGFYFAADSVSDPSGNLVTNAPVKLTVTRAAEPSPIAFLAIGLAALLVALSRNRKNALQASASAT